MQQAVSALFQSTPSCWLVHVSRWFGLAERPRPAVSHSEPQAIAGLQCEHDCKLVDCMPAGSLATPHRRWTLHLELAWTS